MRLALLAALLLTGCTSTRLVDATSAAEVAGAEAAVAGRVADVTLVSGDLYRGEVQYLRLDSTSWADADALYTVSTAEVRTLVVDTRKRALTRGALAGGGSAFVACFIAGTTLGAAFGDGRNAAAGVLFGAACTPGGAFYGLLGGALTSRRTEIVLYDPEAEPAGAAAAGPSE